MGYNNQKQIDRICEYRGLPELKKGMPCKVDGRNGKVWGGNCSANLNVKFDDGQVSNCHPYWKMQIFSENGDVIYDSNAMSTQ